jgi:transposase
MTIEEHSCKCIYLRLPLYSPELSQIEQLWSAVESSLKREFIFKKGITPQKLQMLATKLPSYLLESLHAIPLNVLITAL